MIEKRRNVLKMFLDEFERMSSNQPVVSGVRPNFGPYETPIDIRGNNLGFTRDDVKSVKICGVECIAQAKWISQTHIKCMNLVVTAEEVTGDIIVTTQSGGEGTSDVSTLSFGRESAVCTYSS